MKSMSLIFSLSSVLFERNGRCTWMQSRSMTHDSKPWHCISIVTCDAEVMKMHFHANCTWIYAKKRLSNKSLKLIFPSLFLLTCVLMYFIKHMYTIISTRTDMCCNLLSLQRSILYGAYTNLFSMFQCAVIWQKNYPSFFVTQMNFFFLFFFFVWL